LHTCVEYPQDKVEDAMIAEFALRSTPGRRQVRGDKCGELRLGELNGNRRRSWAFCHITHRKWVDEKPERSSPESLIVAYNTKGYGTHKTGNHLYLIAGGVPGACCPKIDYIHHTATRPAPPQGAWSTRSASAVCAAVP